MSKGVGSKVVEVEGAREVLKKLGANSRSIAGAITAAIYAEGLQIMDDSVDEVPVDLGFLRKSHYVAPPVGGYKAKTVTTEIGYGTSYAVEMHENKHIKHEVGKSHYLRDPYMRALAGMTERIAKRAKSFWAIGVFVQALRGQHPTKPKGDPTEEQRASARRRKEKAAAKAKKAKA